MHQASDLAVDCPSLSVDHEQRLVGRSDHVVAEHTRGRDWSVGIAPLGEGGVHRLPHTCNHLHLACGNELIMYCLSQ